MNKTKLLYTLSYTVDVREATNRGWENVRSGATTPAEWLINHRSTMSTQTTQNLSINGTSLAETEESGLSYDEIYGILSNSRRRNALLIALEHERIKFKELVWLVAEAEYQLPREKISSDERHTVYVSLSQTHIPRLKKDGVITGGRDTGTVSLGENANEVAEFLPEVADDSLGSKLKRSISALC